MKKNFWIIPLLILLVVAGCSKQNIIPPTQPIGSSGTITTEEGDRATVNSGTTNLIGTGERLENYSEELAVNWFTTGNIAVKTGPQYTLILSQRFDDHHDLIFFPKDMWNSFVDKEAPLNIGNYIKFKGDLILLRSAGKSRHYVAVKIIEFKNLGTPAKDQVEKTLAQYKICETDADCVGVYGKCPLPCHMAVNAKYSGTVEEIINDFRNTQKDQCTYKCAEIKEVFCNKESRCEVKQ